MPKPKRIFLTSFLLFQSLSLIFLAFLFFTTRPVLATTIHMDFEVPISNDTISMEVGPDSIGKYIKALYNYLIGSVGIIATVVMMYGGVLWITAMGNPTQITEAKAWMTAAMTGMVIALSSYVILYWVNPDLLNFKNIAPTEISGTTSSADSGIYGCCKQNIHDNNVVYDKCYQNMSQSACTDLGKTYTDGSTFSANTFCANDCNNIKDTAIGCCRITDSGGNTICKKLTQTDCSPSNPSYSVMTTSIVYSFKFSMNDECVCTAIKL